jgi:hypothetical protein
MPGVLVDLNRDRTVFVGHPKESAVLSKTHEPGPLWKDGRRSWRTDSPVAAAATAIVHSPSVTRPMASSLLACLKLICIPHLVGGGQNR